MIMKFERMNAGESGRVVTVGGCAFGGPKIILIAGPYKLRTSPCSFRGLSEKWLEIHAEAAGRTI